MRKTWIFAGLMLVALPGCIKLPDIIIKPPQPSPSATATPVPSPTPTPVPADTCTTERKSEDEACPPGWDSVTGKFDDGDRYFCARYCGCNHYGSVFPPEGHPAETCPSPTPIPSPTAVPTPTPITQPSNVDRIRIFHYDNSDEGCKIKGKPFIFPPPPCPAIHLTATPKQKNGDDSPDTGKSLTWTFNGTVVSDNAVELRVPCGVINAGPREMTFNREILARPTCPIKVRVDFIDSKGNAHWNEVEVR